jgi:hypothetical protein
LQFRSLRKLREINIHILWSGGALTCHYPHAFILIFKETNEDMEVGGARKRETRKIEEKGK